MNSECIREIFTNRTYNHGYQLFEFYILQTNVELFIPDVVKFMI
jgi:hypothetical protein